MGEGASRSWGWKDRRKSRKLIFQKNNGISSGGCVLYWCTFLASHVHMFTVYGKSKPAEAYLIQSKYFQTSSFSHKLLLQ